MKAALAISSLHSRARVLCAVLAVLLWVGPAAADEDEFDEPPVGWLPSLMLGFDVHRQEFDVSGVSSLGETATNTTGYTDGGKKTILTSLFSIDLLLDTPPLGESPDSPRLFAKAGVQIPLSDEFSLLRSVTSFSPVDPMTPTFCPNFVGGVPSTGYCDQTLSSTLTLNVNWSAGVGAEFRLPIESRDIRVRGSVDYFGQSLDFEGEAQRDDRIAGGSIGSTFLVDGASTSEILHGIGTHLILSANAGRFGPILLSAFVETRLYWLLTTGDIAFGATNADGTVMFVAEPDALVAQGGAGLRISWGGAR